MAAVTVVAFSVLYTLLIITNSLQEDSVIHVGYFFSLEAVKQALSTAITLPAWVHFVSFKLNRQMDGQSSAKLLCACLHAWMHATAALHSSPGCSKGV